MRRFFATRPLSRAIGKAPRRRLTVEPLEARQLLAVSPWQNPAKPLDVDGDGFIVSTDALLIANRLNSAVDTKLPPLQPGQKPEFYYDVDGDGYATASDVVLIANRLNTATAPPTLSAALANDTGPGGVPNQDSITADPTIGGTVTVVPALTTLKAWLDDELSAISIRDLVRPNGSFTLTPTLLQQLHGGPLVDGQIVVHFKGINEMALEATATVSLLLDRATWQPQRPDLPTASDTGDSNTDNLTRIYAPPIHVVAEAGSTVTLFVDDQPVLQRVASPTAIFNLPAMADGTYQLTARSVDQAGNVSALSEPLALMVHKTIPTVTMITVPYQDDLTPIVSVAVMHSDVLPNGTPIYLDIDRNNDHDFDDANEMATAASLVVDGKASLQVNVPLADPGPLATASIQLRARVVDAAGNVGVDVRTQIVDRRASSALADYVHQDDGLYSFDEPQEILPRQEGYRAYAVRMTSQQWRSAAEVDQPVWEHWVTIVVPTILQSQTAILNITGNDRSDEVPTYVDVPTWLLALTTNSVVVEVSQDPNKPLIFAGDGVERRENATIAYSFDQFLKHPDDTEWPVLVAMVKGAVKAMDTAQTLVADQKFETLPVDFSIDDFVVTGAANQGWITWLTAAVDSRVKAIIPAIFDSLNQDEQSVRRYSQYGFFTEELQDYAELGLFTRTLTAAGSQLGSIVDPYRYLENGNFEIPKLLILSPGDEFFVPDAAQLYFDDLPGTQNYLRYMPNTGHFVDLDGLFASAVFARAIATNQHLPEFSWEMLADGSIRVSTVDAPTEVKLWQATNPEARDFRFTQTSVVWTSSTLADQGGGVYVGNVPLPETGATAFFIELTYPSGVVLPPATEIPFKFTTQVSVQTRLPLYVWPFPTVEGLSPDVIPALGQAATDGNVTPEAIAAAAMALATEDQSPADFALPPSKPQPNSPGGGRNPRRS